MKIPSIFGFSVGFSIILAGFNASAALSGSQLLDEVIAKPGNWNQMCSVPMPISADVPLPLYSGLATRSFFISAANRERLRGRRDDVVPEIVRRLHHFVLTRKAATPAGAGFSESGQDPNELSGLMLDIIGDLDAVEALPDLMRLEDDLNARLVSATNGDLSVVPLLNLDGVASMMMIDPNVSPEKFQNDNRVFQSRIFQREMLATMAKLLRHKNFPAMLKSDYETEYHKYLKHEAENDSTLASIKTEQDIPDYNKEWIWIDAVYHLPAHHAFKTPTMPYTPETRREIRQFVAEFLKQPMDGSGNSK